MGKFVHTAIPANGGAFFEGLNGISTRVTDLEKTSDRRGVTFGLVDRLFWIAVTAAVGIGAWWLRGE